MKLILCFVRIQGDREKASDFQNETTLEIWGQKLSLGVFRNT